MMVWAILLPLVAGSLVYCVLVLVAAARYPSIRRHGAETCPPISVLKPLEGLDDEFEENLRSFFEQAYPCFEILLAAPSRQDPAMAIAERLRASYPAVSCKLIVAGEPSYRYRKIYLLDRMLPVGRTLHGRGSPVEHL